MLKTLSEILKDIKEDLPVVVYVSGITGPICDVNHKGEINDISLLNMKCEYFNIYTGDDTRIEINLR